MPVPEQQRPHDIERGHFEEGAPATVAGPDHVEELELVVAEPQSSEVGRCGRHRERKPGEVLEAQPVVLLDDRLPVRDPGRPTQSRLGPVLYVPLELAPGVEDRRELRGRRRTAARIPDQQARWTHHVGPYPPFMKIAVLTVAGSGKSLCWRLCRSE